MKSISSSIVTAAGVFGLANTTTGSSVPILILFLASIITLSLGLVGWWQALKHDH
ncbi:MAG: hypothetical protein ACSHX9_15025 [Luteolibacter sp.]